MSTHNNSLHHSQEHSSHALQVNPAESADDVIAQALHGMAEWPVDHCAGAAILLKGNGGAREWTYGDPHREFPLASVTKLLVAYTVMVAVEEGALELDEQLECGATVRQLLSHTGGVGFDSVVQEKAPGTRRIYSSAGYELLAEAVSAATDMPFEEYFSLALCEPLGMQQTRLVGSAGHGAISSVADLSAFALEVLHPQLLHPSTVAHMLEVQSPEVIGIVPGYGMFRPCPWGLGFEIKGQKNPHWTAVTMPPRIAGHFGQSGTFLWVDPAGGVAGVALTDRDFGSWAKPVWAPFNDAVYAALLSLKN